MGIQHKLVGFPALVLGKAVTTELTNETAVKELMQHGIDKDGRQITPGRLDYFNDNSSKDLSDLVDELNEGEAILYRDPKTHRICLERYTTKIILIHSDKDKSGKNKYVAEILHAYRGDQYFQLVYSEDDSLILPKNVKNVKKMDESYSYSESMIDGETDKETAIRCLWQEARLQPGDYTIDHAVRYGVGRAGHANFHESSTYADIFSKEYVATVFYVYTRAFDLEKPVPMYEDSGKKYSLRVWREFDAPDSEKTVGQWREEGDDI